MPTTEFTFADVIRTMTPRTAAYVDDDGQCLDHDAKTTYEDATFVQWICRYCGAEGEWSA